MRCLKNTTRRNFVTLATTGFLSACASSRSPFFSTIANFRRPINPEIDAKKIEAMPYASLQAWFKGSSKALLVLGEYQPQRRLVWYSADRQSVTTWGPFVVRVLGLEVSVRDTTFSGGWDTDLRTVIGKPIEKTVDFQSGLTRITMQTKSTFRYGEVEDVEFVDKSRRLRQIVEHVVANKVHRFKNMYWIDEGSGFCWKSRQLVIPTMAPFNIKIAKAPLRT